MRCNLHFRPSLEPPDLPAVYVRFAARLKHLARLPDRQTRAYPTPVGGRELAKAKGTVVIDLVKALRRDKTKARSVLPAKFHHYLEERIVIASWYPLEDYVVLLKAAGQVLPRDEGGNVYHAMGRTAARAHMSGTYSRFKDKANRQATFTLLASMYDTGEMKVAERSAGRAALEYHGFALPTREVCDTFTGYNLERMVLLGFDNPTVHHVKCRAVGDPSCRWELEWKGKGEF